MAKISNPRKNFQFSISIFGINPFLCQKVKLPDSEFDIAEHGDSNFDVKTAGRKKLGMLVLDKIQPADLPDERIWNWQEEIGSTTFGGGSLPSEYKRNIIVDHYGPDGITIVKSWELIGCWPQKINGLEFDRKGTENMIESIEFCVDEIIPL